MADASRAILQKMLERLFASLIGGPGMNCRPHSSRQRIDLAQIARLGNVSPEAILRSLVSEEHRARITCKAVRPKREVRKPKEESASAVELSDEEKRLARQWSEQQTIVSKLRAIADDARTYEHDTGVHVLNLGFPLLSIPPGNSSAARRGSATRRIVAPIAFIPVTLEVKSGTTISIDIACKGEGVDLVRPNIALIAWIEQQTGKRTPELFDDREAENPWREIQELVAHVATGTGLAAPTWLGETGLSEEFQLLAAPRAEDDADGRIIPSAVLGLYPMANEGLLRDTQAMAGGEALDGPVRSFLQVDVDLAQVSEQDAESNGKKPRTFADERLVTHADPCQSRAALLAREAAGLVIHGPPGTGKSQTITNIIGDHLARGQRVLMVCDKRTALDVVAHRLQHLGFGPLVALVHDPQRDQRDLYKAIRERLENLAEVRTHAGAAKEVERIDVELQQLHNELSNYWKCLMAADAAEALSFHDVMGEWLANASEVQPPMRPEMLQEISLQEGRSHKRLITELFERAGACEFHANPWEFAKGLSLATFLTRSMPEMREQIHACVPIAETTRIDPGPDVPPLKINQLDAETAQREKILGILQSLAAKARPAILKRWSTCDVTALDSANARLQQGREPAELVRKGSLDADLLAGVQSALPPIEQINMRLAKLARYLESARKWHAFLALGRKRGAREVLDPLGLPLTPENAERARNFFVGLRARIILRDVLAALMDQTPAALPPDAELLRDFDAHSEAIAVQIIPAEFDGIAEMRGAVRKALADSEVLPRTVEAFEKSVSQCHALQQLQAALLATKMVRPEALAIAVEMKQWSAADFVLGLDRLLPQLENLLRAEEVIAALPPPLGTTAQLILAEGLPAAEGMSALDKLLLTAEITRRLRDNPALQAMDAHPLDATFQRYRELELTKRQRVREAAVHLWVSRQKERLLATTLTRASTLGADLRRRLTMRGERALRLRQVVEVGQNIEGGDPLFDMTPVWMASPETVAQIFPRLPVVDVVIFDEASQCRLEEALPVLTRGKRVVIAGDPKQLPPTRFFESAITASEDAEVEGDQDLFERQQGEVEDLLTAALNLAIENAYLDVHYRSRNADLISFSNDQFYHHRLQAIPGHPANRTRYSPLTLYRANGVYEERANEKEAQQVCRIVRDLLKRADPPSIGIACFNMVQRDLIVEQLDALALEDGYFARRLAEARSRQGEGSFEGLFVKNLENVQGDERDHIIISTTYGPTKEGRFYQRFGPLGRLGGGRRLNVLITRARQEVHLVTSIPHEVYLNLPEVPAGQTPGGAWLLFAYLRFAEHLAALYAEARGELPEEALEPPQSPSGNGDRTPPMPSGAQVIIRPQQRSLASRFSESIGLRLATAHAQGSTVHWGNDGFCVDVALAHPLRPDDVTIGVLCDGTRFRNATDPVEWDIFRTQIHESQGWKLHRLWTPHFFRDPAEHLAAIAAKSREHAAQEKPPDALGVMKEDQT